MCIEMSVERLILFERYIIDTEYVSASAECELTDLLQCSEFTAVCWVHFASLNRLMHFVAQSLVCSLTVDSTQSSSTSAKTESRPQKKGLDRF